jgi:7-cyano-7-deazaguanine synthase
MTTLAQNRALVLFSGGQDSLTCLMWALQHFEMVETIGFDYGQRHHIELTCRQDILKDIKSHVVFAPFKHKLGDDHVLDLSILKQITDTALTTEQEITFAQNGLPNTFVPARNLLFFQLAATIGYRRNLKHLVGGMCETDYSGYPDCRDDSLKALQVALNLGMESRFVIHTPLMWKDKAQTFKWADKLGGRDFVAYVIKHSHTCYNGNRSLLHDWGYGCGNCPACELRKNGWIEYLNI